MPTTKILRSRRFSVRLLAVVASAAAALAMTVTATSSQASPTPATTGYRTQYAIAQPICPQPADPTLNRCFAMKREIVAKGTPGAQAVTTPNSIGLGPAGGLTPDDLAAFYDYNPSTYRGNQVIALVDWFDYSAALSDLDHFDAQYGLPKETPESFRKLNQNGKTSPLPKAEAGTSEELALDIESARGVCHTCRLVLLEANSPSNADIAVAENEAVKLGATEISNSFGAPEKAQPASILAAYNHPGIVITASTGDDGWFGWDRANGSDPGSKSEGAAEFPSTDPEVIAVGGTQLVLNNDATRNDEVVWNNNGADDATGIDNSKAEGAGGGGCSTLYAAQAWQLHYAGYAAAGCNGKRLAADISAIADPDTGFDVYDSQTGGWATIGGTSLASPVVAAMFALAGGSGGARYPASTLYTNGVHRAWDLFDVKQGGNSFCGGDSTLNCGNDVYSFSGEQTHNPNGLGAGVLDCSFVHTGADPSQPPAEHSECNATTGYDGPSGLGTPDTIGAFTNTSPSLGLAHPASLKKYAPESFGAVVKEPISGINVTKYLWSWGDGSTTVATTPGVRHEYSKSGKFNISVTIVDSSYQVELRSVVMTLGEPAVVHLTHAASVRRNAKAGFSLAGTTDPNTGAKITKATWKWGDGKTTTLTSTGATTHTYTKTGTFTVTLVLLDSTGVTTTVTSKVKVVS